MSSAAQLPYKRLRLHRPDLKLVAECLDRAVKAAFVEGSVDVVDCPDLTVSDGGGFAKLAAKGICGGATLVHAGGVPYLLPTPQRHRRYPITDLLSFAECPDGLAIGAGAAASALFGKNAEFVANQGPLGNGCRVASVHSDSDKTTGVANCRLSTADFAEINLLGDLLCSRGEVGGRVLRLQATGWKSAAATDDERPEAGEKNWWRAGRFAEFLQLALAREFNSQSLPVGLGGVFVLTGSAAHMHVMPEFSPTPLTCLDEVNSWLHFVDMPDPLLFCGTVASHDPAGWSLRLEHFHGWNTETEAFGGHYHHDVKPETASYLAYLSLADSLVRVDPPNGIESLNDPQSE